MPLLPEYTTSSAEETVHVGKTIARDCPQARLFLISGDFGAGKTTLIKGLATGLLLSGIPDSLRNSSEEESLMGAVKSPSFTLVNEYSYGESKVFHADFYRLNTQNDLDFMDFDEILSKKTNRLIVEWFDKIPLPENLLEAFPPVILKVGFLSASERKISVLRS